MCSSKESTNRYATFCKFLSNKITGGHNRHRFPTGIALSYPKEVRTAAHSQQTTKLFGKAVLQKPRAKRSTTNNTNTDTTSPPSRSSRRGSKSPPVMQIHNWASRRQIKALRLTPRCLFLRLNQTTAIDATITISLFRDARI